MVGVGNLSLKKLRGIFNTQAVQTDTENADEEQASPFTYSAWENLPYVALVEIYRYLPNKDKFNASLTCQAWSMAFSRPEVWQQGHFCFNGEDDWRALRFAEFLVSRLRHLSIDCQEGSVPSNTRDMATTSNVCAFLDRCKNYRLVTLKLSNMGRLSTWFEWSTMHDVVRALGDLLSSQTTLELLDLSTAGFSFQQGSNILNLMADKCGPTLTSLTINGFFYTIVPVCIATPLQAFAKLTELTVSDDNLSDALLNILASLESLVHLRVFAETPLEVSPPSPAAWVHLTMSRPHLEASYYILHKKFGKFPVVASILTPGIPLVALELKWSDIGLFWEFFCVHIANCFKKLRRLDVVICTTMFSADHFLDVIVDQCLLLEEISITDKHGLNAALQAPIKKSIRKTLARQPASRLRRFTLDGVDVNLKVLLMRYLPDWLLDRID